MSALAKEQSMRITKIQAHVGAEVTGVDLRNVDAIAATLRDS